MDGCSKYQISLKLGILYTNMLVIYRYLANHPQTQWLKTTILNLSQLWVEWIQLGGSFVHGVWSSGDLAGLEWLRRLTHMELPIDRIYTQNNILTYGEKCTELCKRGIEMGLAICVGYSSGFISSFFPLGFFFRWFLL